MLLMMVAAFLATLGFAIMFNIHGRNVIIAAIGGSVGAVVYYLSQQAGVSLFQEMLYTALSIALYSEIMARVFKTPVTIYLICALICFVPGGLMYYAMLEVMNNHNALATDYVMQVLMSASALAIGIVIVSTIVKLFFKVKRRVKD